MDEPNLQSSEPLAVLIVENHHDTAWSLALLLSLHQPSFKTVIASDGCAAIEVARINRPQVVILDIGLPGMNGFEVARALRLLPETRDAYILMYSGFAGERFFREALEAGCDHYIVKPGDPEELLLLISAHLEEPDSRRSSEAGTALGSPR